MHVRNLLQALLEKTKKGRSSMQITIREQEVLCLVLCGHTNKEIAEALNISGYTVRDHVSSILRKKKAKTRAILLAKYLPKARIKKLQPPTSVGLCIEAGSR